MPNRACDVCVAAAVPDLTAARAGAGRTSVANAADTTVRTMRRRLLIVSTGTPWPATATRAASVSDQGRRIPRDAVSPALGFAQFVWPSAVRGSREIGDDSWVAR